jgi:hypothetical protein
MASVARGNQHHCLPDIHAKFFAPWLMKIIVFGEIGNVYAMNVNDARGEWIT